jgi:hypothetical protein
MPKCAGTSIAHSFAKALSLRTTNLDARASAEASKVCGDELVECRKRLLAYELACGGTGRFISGHWAVDLNICRRYANTTDFVTVLRDPVDRWFSSFLYNRYKESNHMAIKSDIVDYVVSDRARLDGQLYLRRLIGFTDDHKNVAQAIIEAESVLQGFAVVGFVDMLDQFKSALEARYDVRFHLPNLNRTPAPDNDVRQLKESSEVKEKVEELCAFDNELYKRVRDRHVRTRSGTIIA